MSPLESLRARLALPVGENAVFDGWTSKAVDTAAAQLGIDPAQARLAFPKTKIDMIDAYIAAVDAAMLAEYPPERIAAMKVRDRIRAQLWYRLESMVPGVPLGLADVVHRALEKDLGVRWPTVESFALLREHLHAFSDEPLESADFERAAEHFNTCRRRGVQGSNTDFLICAAAERRELPILTTDADFTRFAAVLPIALHGRA